MPDHYDVIIIGSGAGGGTLAHTLADAGREILHPRARRLPAPGDGQLGPGAGVHRRASTSPRTPGTTPTASRSSPRSTTSSAAPRSSTAPRSTACGPQDFGELRHVDGLSPAWPVDLRRLRALVLEGRVALPGPRQRRRGPDRGPLDRSRTRGRRCRTSRGSSSWPTSWPRRGYHPFHAPCGILLDEADRARSTCIRCTWCDGYPCLVHAKADAETIAVRPVLDLPERDAAGRRRGRRSSTTDDVGRTRRPASS